MSKRSFDFKLNVKCWDVLHFKNINQDIADRLWQGLFEESFFVRYGQYFSLPLVRSRNRLHLPQIVICDYTFYCRNFFITKPLTKVSLLRFTTNSPIKWSKITKKNCNYWNCTWRNSDKNIFNTHMRIIVRQTTAL